MRGILFLLGMIGQRTHFHGIYSPYYTILVAITESEQWETMTLSSSLCCETLQDRVRGMIVSDTSNNTNV